MIRIGPNKMQVKKIHRMALEGKKAEAIAKVMNIKVSGVQPHVDYILKEKKKKDLEADKAKAADTAKAKAAADQSKTPAKKE